MGIPILVKRYLYTEMVPLDPGLRPLCNNLDDPKPEIKINKTAVFILKRDFRAISWTRQLKNTVKQQNLGLMGIMAQSCPVQIHYETRTTRTPAFWDTHPPPPAPWLPILMIHIRPQVKTRQSQSYKFKKIAKNSNFEILLETLHATHLLKLFHKMYKYEMDPTRTVGATERTRDAGLTLDGCGTDGRTDRRTEWNQYPPPPPPQQLRCAGGMRKTSQSVPVTPNGLHSNQKYTHWKP